MVANTFMRAPGESVGTFALESAIDELADAMGIDPIELRRRNEPEKDPTSGAAVLARATSSRPTGAAPSGSAGTGAARRPRARRDGEWLIGHGRRHRHLSLLPDAGRRGAHHARPPTGARSSQMARARDGHGHRDRAGAARRRAARAAARAGHASSTATRACRPARWPAARRRPRRSCAAVTAAQRGAGQASCSSSPATIRRSRGLRARTRSRRATAVCATATSRTRGETYASILRRAGRERGRRPRPTRRCRSRCMKYSMHSYGAQFCEVARQCSHRRDAGHRACSARSTPAASSTPRPRRASSAAASSWGSAWR